MQIYLILRNGATAQRHNGAMAQWRDVLKAQRRNGKMEQNDYNNKILS
jgi:hypothetical protein